MHQQQPMFQTGSNRRSQPEVAVSGELPRKDSVVYVEKDGMFPTPFVAITI